MTDIRTAFLAALDDKTTKAIMSKAAYNAELVDDLIADMQAMITKLQAVKAEFDGAATTGNGREFDGACQSMQGISHSTELNGSWRHTAIDASDNNI